MAGDGGLGRPVAHPEPDTPYVGACAHLEQQDADFASLIPGYWVVYHPGNFADGHEALNKCRAVGRTTEQSCVGRYLSRVEQHRNLVCRFSDRPDAAHCSRG